MGKPGPHLILFELCPNVARTKANQVGNDQVVSVMRALSERSEDKSQSGWQRSSSQRDESFVRT
jgi:hypothetical protein